MFVHIHVFFIHTWTCIYIYLNVVQISIRLQNFLTKFRRNETKHDLGKLKFRRNFDRDETEKVYFGETLVKSYSPSGFNRGKGAVSR